MLRILFSCLLITAHFTSLISLEKTHLFEGTTQGVLTIESTESDQQVVVQSYILENISEKPMLGLFLSINADRENQKKQVSQQLFRKNNLWQWWKQNHLSAEEKGAYSSLTGSTLQIPSRSVPAHGVSLREFFFNDKWHLVDDKQDLIYLALDNRTVAGYEDVADEPFLALRTKTTGLEGSYNFAKACSNFARLDIFPAEFDGLEPDNEELRKGWKDYHYDLYPNENVVFKANGIIEQTIALKERSPVAGKLNLETCYPIVQIINESNSSVTLEDQNFLLEPNQAYHFDEQKFAVDLNIRGNNGKIIIVSKVNEKPRWGLGSNQIDLGMEKNTGAARLTLQYDLCENCTPVVAIDVINSSHHFDHVIPYFELTSKETALEKIWWQISNDKDFEFIVPNFQGIQDFTHTIHLDSCTDTFFNPQEAYYFRVKGLQNGQWSAWSPSFEFSVSKPEQIKDPVFKKIDREQYQISWEPSVESDMQYLIFASNAYDFMPSIYASQQYQVIDKDTGESEDVNNLIAKTSESSITIGTEYAFYRIIAERNGQYSIPSPIIRVYDYGLSIPRTVLQASPNVSRSTRTERMAFPPAYPHLQESINRKSPLNFKHLVKDYYVKAPHVDQVVWDTIQPYLLPENHPVKPKLDRLFKKRITLSSETLKKAGFIRPDPMRFSKTIVSKNKNIDGYMFKLFSDDQKGMSDWSHLLNRVTGAIYIQDALNRYNLNHLFVVPTKWLYSLPGDPAPPGNLERKNFILVENALDIYTGKENNKMWRSPIINPITLTWIYMLLQELGLNDSPYNFNMPIAKDNRITFIDTEDHHKWPVPFHKLWPFLSPEMGNFWNKLCEKGGP